MHIDLRKIAIDMAIQILTGFLTGRLNEWWSQHRGGNLDDDAIREALLDRLKVHFSDAEAEALVKQVIKEVKLLAREDPDLEYEEGALSLRPPSQTSADDPWDERVRERRQRLEALVDRRRRQIGAPSVDY